MELFKLFGTIAIQNSDANKAIDQTTGKASQSESKITNAFKKIGTAVATYFAVSKITAFGQECINMASDVEEMQNKFDVVFSGMTETVSEWADEYAKAIGRNSNTIKGYLADNQNMFVGMGMTREAGAELSEQMVSLALDLASFNNLQETDAVNALSKALMGESESAKTLGAVINDNTLAMAMEKMGIEGKFQALSEAEKMEVRYQAILMQSTDAVGDCERSLDSYKGKTIQLESAKEKLYETIGTLLLPVMTKWTEALTDVVSWVQSAVEWGKEHETEVVLIATAVGTLTTAIIAYNIAQKMMTAEMTLASIASATFGSVMAFLTSPITLVVGAIGALIAIGILLYNNWEFIQEKATEIWNFIVSNFENAVESIKSAFAPIGEFFENIWIGIQNTFSHVTDWFRNVFSSAWQAVKDVFSTGGKIFDGIKEGIVNVFKTVVNGIIGGINKVIAIPFNAINGILNGIHNVNILGIKPFDWIHEFAVPQIPQLETGGVLEEGQVGLLEGNGAEAVVPLEKNRQWISRVSEEMKVQGIGGSDKETLSLLQQILAVLSDIKERGDELPDNLLDSMANGLRFNVNGREFARMVKAVN